MFLLNESPRFFRESYAKSIHAFNGRTNLFLFIWPFRFFCISLRRKGHPDGPDGGRVPSGGGTAAHPDAAHLITANPIMTDMKQNLKNVVLAAGLACTALTGQAQNAGSKTTQTVTNSLMKQSTLPFNAPDFSRIKDED